MPIYEYQCQSCGHRSEAIQRVSDPPLETCEECSGALRKLISAPAFQFKGSGWYVTDYARKDGGGEMRGSRESSAKESSKGGAGESEKRSAAASSTGSDTGSSAKASTGKTKSERQSSSDG